MKVLTCLPMPAMRARPAHLGIAAILLALPLISPLCLATALPEEPMRIGTTPQFLLDDYVVDNRWAIKYGDASQQMVIRVLHAPKKHPKNPLLVQPGMAQTGERPMATQVNVIPDKESGKLRMWYQVSVDRDSDPATPGNAYAVAYAESVDGIKWELPKVGKFEWNGSKDNNVIWMGEANKGAASPHVIELPEKDRRGYRYAMVYNGAGLHLVGSRDGREWDKSSNVMIAKMHSDTSNTLLFDERRGEYVLFCRPKHIYRAGGDTFGDGDKGNVLYTGESRRIARMASKELWTEWKSQPQVILQADELDAPEAFTAFYGITVKLHGDIYWGFLQRFRWNTVINSELTFSRDGIDFQRLPTRPQLIERGPDGTWEDGLVFVGHQGWVDRGDEWYVYYSGSDGPHNGPKGAPLSERRKTAIGLATIRKERFISMRGPEDGGVISTRRILWPGGKLVVNADARPGEMRARITDERRRVIPGFEYKDCVTFNGDSLQHTLTWKGQSTDSLKGKVIRIEFFLKKADLFTFRATGS